ncbi:hypothetical protein OTSUT76_0341 [Orientia tsutsugamushi str. UT76]|nr:hypothetical protein OTSUT76_0341 [Orientia tsutsugamushi str. UT76]
MQRFINQKTKELIESVGCKVIFLLHSRFKSDREVLG